MSTDGANRIRHELDALRSRIQQLRSGPGGPAPDLLLRELEAAHDQLRAADETLRAQRHEIDRLRRMRCAEHAPHERLLDTLPAAVVVTDAQGLVQEANAAAAALLRTGGDELLGRPLLDFVDGAGDTEVGRLLTGAARPMTDVRTVTTFRPIQGEPVVVEVAAGASRRGTAGGEVTWVLLAGSAPRLVPARQDDGRLANSLVELTQLRSDTSGTREVLTRVARVCQRAFPHPVAASISIGDPAEPTLLVAGSELAESVDGAQMSSGEGPCRTAWVESASVHSPDLREDGRWPRLRSLLGSSAVRSAVAVPIVVAGRVAGALNLYSEESGLAEQEALEHTRLLATTVAAVLQQVDAKSELETAAVQLRTALESRATIDQAKGMIMAIHGCGPEDAFEMLARMSSTSNVKLRDLAARMVERASQGIEDLPDQRRDVGPDRGRGPLRPPSS